MLKFQFLKWFHVIDNKIKLSFHFIKFLKWFGGEELGASASWVQTLMNVCINIHYVYIH
jgi:hypothetical protein